MSVVLFIIILAVLIAVHEFGHFITAKWAGIRVDEFALGFPPKILTWKKGETRYSLNLIPFGGFVKIFGEDPLETTDGADKHRSFSAKPRHIQALVLVAGILGNIIFAWLVLSLALVIGLPAPADYAGQGILTNPKVTILGTMPASPAERAGFLPGDIIEDVAVSYGSVKVSSIEEVQQFIDDHANEEVTVHIARKGKEKSFTVVPEWNLISERAAIGISLGSVGILKASPVFALYEGAKLTTHSVYQVASGLFTLIKNAVIGEGKLSQITGPVGIVDMVGEASDFGLAYLLGFTAFISINLAVINVIPFPALDGGRLLFVAIEAVIRRPINVRFQHVANFVGFMILISLMVLVTYQDILRLVR